MVSQSEESGNQGGEHPSFSVERKWSTLNSDAEQFGETTDYNWELLCDVVLTRCKKYARSHNRKIDPLDLSQEVVTRLFVFSRRLNETPLFISKKIHLIDLVTERTAIDLLRKSHSKERFVTSFSDNSINPNRIPASKQHIDLIKEHICIERISPPTQVVLNLLLEGFTLSEIATKTGKSSRTVSRIVLTIRLLVLSDLKKIDLS